MLQNLKVRLAIIAVAVLGSLFFLYRNYEEQNSIVTLGLDLRGGSHFALEIDDTKVAFTPEQRADAIDRALKIVRTRVDELGVAEPVIQKSGSDRIIVELAGIAREGRAKEVLQRSAFLQFQLVRPISDLQPSFSRIDRAVAEAFGAGAAARQPAQSPVGGLFKEKGAAGPDTAAAGTPFTSKVVPAGEGEFIVQAADVPEVTRYLAHPAVLRNLPRGTELLWGVPETGTQNAEFRRLVLVESRAMMTGEYLEGAQAQTDPQTMRPIVVFELSRRGGRIFERVTGENVGRQMAIVLDDRVVSAPVIQSQIANRGQIELGGSTLEEASDLALVLRAGALPAPLRIVEERTVGPSLGADSIEKGQLAGLVGISAVVLMVIGYYHFSGVLAVLALAIYVLLVLGGLAAIPGAVLTFPGIAGLILSVGMAVDANVLIFERIREELGLGRSVRASIREGFAHALSAIVDSNLTTLITAAILFYVGTGPVQGFAVTLAIGIIASMFTAIFVTRTLFMLYSERRTAAQGISI
ncbi:MAG TPA: protein translocase subunit SecD [Longimicrobiaceae bacterium]|nr:protein translocase subunit SecD [Longimicrobiaceae bacterium]